MNSDTMIATSRQKKDWDQAMESFDLSIQDGTDSLHSSRKSATAPADTDTQRSKDLYWTPRILVIAACAFTLGNIPLQSTHNSELERKPLIVADEQPQLPASFTSDSGNSTITASEHLAVGDNDAEFIFDSTSEEYATSANSLDPVFIVHKDTGATSGKATIEPGETPDHEIAGDNDADVVTENAGEEAAYEPATIIADANSATGATEQVTLTKNLAIPTRALSTLSFDADDDTATLANGNWITHKIRKKDSLARILAKHGISPAFNELKKNKSLTKKIAALKEGDLVRIKRNNATLLELIAYTQHDKNTFVITRHKDKYQGEYKRKVVETRQARATLLIKNSLLYDANKEGIPRDFIKQIAKIFDRDVNLTRDLRKGDRVTIVYEQIFHQGNLIANSEIIASELLHNGRTHRAIRYIMEDGKIDYFDDKGRDLSKAFKRHALDQHTRPSSGFGFRRHPVYKRVRMHHGTDYPARYGTPITATGNGFVKHIGRKGGYGRTIVIAHNGGYTTLYGHLSKYAKGLKKGQKVYLGDTIGYVGSSGASTGPHLHYEFRIKGKPQNPEKVELPHQLSLNRAERDDFLKESRNLIRQLDVLHRFAEEQVDISRDFGG